MTAAGRSPPPVPSPIREITSAGTRVLERSTNRTPSGKSPSNAWATRTPSLVLPTPPGPVRVRSRWDRRIVTAFSSSSRRPTSDVKGMGSRWIGWLVTLGWPIERRVLAEDPALQLLDLGRRVDAELSHQVERRRRYAGDKQYATNEVGSDSGSTYCLPRGVVGRVAIKNA